MTPSDYKYWAFVSYSHRDSAWGDWLHKRLETYRIPGRLVGGEGRDGPVPKRLFPVFRDREELPTSADLNKNLQAALEGSRYLIVICSPHSANSRWVGEEIKTFKALGRENRILCLVVDGEPNASDVPGTGAECFHELLRFRLDADGAPTSDRVEPIAADAREGKDGRKLAALKLISGLLGVDFDELRQRDRQRRRIRWAQIATAAVVAIGLLGAIGYQSLEERRISAEVEQSLFLANKSFEQSEAGNTELGILLALEALPKNLDHPDRAYAPDAEAALYKAVFNHRLVAVLDHQKYTGDVVAFSADGRRLLTHDGTESIHLWDPKTGIEIKNISGNLLRSSAVFSHDGRRFALKAADGKHLLIFDSATGKQQLKIPVEIKVEGFTFNKSGTRLIVAGFGYSYKKSGQRKIYKAIHLLDLETARDLGKMTNVGRYYNSYREPWNLSFDGRRILFVNPVKDKVQVFSTDTGKLIDEFSNKKSYYTPHLSPDGNRVLLWVKGEGWSLRPLDDGGKTLPLENTSGKSTEGHRPFFSADGSLLFFRSKNLINVWNAKTGVEIGSIRLADGIWLISVTRDGRLFTTERKGGVGVIWSTDQMLEITSTKDVMKLLQNKSIQRAFIARTGKTARIWVKLGDEAKVLKIASYKDGNGKALKVRLGPDGRRAVTRHFDKDARLWDVEKSRAIWTLPSTYTARLPFSPPVAFSPDGRYLASIDDKKVDLWDMASGRRLFSTKPSKIDVSSVSLSPDGKRLLASQGVFLNFGSEKAGPIEVWDVTAKRLLFVLQSPEKNDVLFATFSPDGKRIFSSYLGGLARLWDSETGKLVAVLEQQGKGPFIGRFGPKGKKLAVSDFGPNGGKGVRREGAGEVTIRNAATGATNIKVNFDGTIGDLRFSPDGGRLAVLAPTSRILDTASGEEIARLAGEQIDATLLAFDPSGEMLAVSYNNGTVKLWDARSGELIRSLRGHEDAAWSVLFSPNGRLLLTTALDGTHRLWDVATGRALASFKGAPPMTANSGAFSPDGKTFALNGEGTKVWSLPPHGQALIERAGRLVKRTLTSELRLLYRLD